MARDYTTQRDYTISGPTAEMQLHIFEDALIRAVLFFLVFFSDVDGKSRYKTDQESGIKANGED